MDRLGIAYRPRGAAMAPAPDEFSAPGAVKYESDTMTVGDGTWDFRDNTFLLPNLQGTNFETTRYNGWLLVCRKGSSRMRI